MFMSSMLKIVERENKPESIIFKNQIIINIQSDEKIIVKQIFTRK